MAEVRFSPEAQGQLDAIGDQRLEQAGRLASERLRAAFDRFFLMVRDFPRVGTVFHRVGAAEFRQFPIEGFVVRFQVDESGDVVIVDIRHGQRRGPALDVLEQRGGAS